MLATKDERARARDLILRLLGRRSARLQHLLHEIEPHSRLRLVLGDREEVQQVIVAHIRAARVPMLIHEPLELGRVRVPRADVLRLQMLQLTVDVVALAHFSRRCPYAGSRNSSTENIYWRI